jgi:GNAT superfamily N-acetyltransferase
MDAGGLPIRPLPDGSDVRKSTAADLTDVVEAVARSFYEDPIFRWIVPDDALRPRQLERGFALFARRVWFPRDETYTTDRLIGGAFWMPPGTWHLSLFKQLSMLPSMAVILRGALPRLLRLLNAIEARHPHEPHYYLPVIGIRPEWQGRGFGSALLRPILERCDRERLPAYLEASSERNRALYERHGFAVLEEMRVSDSPPLWRMWREVKP